MYHFTYSHRYVPSILSSGGITTPPPRRFSRVVKPRAPLLKLTPKTFFPKFFFGHVGVGVPCTVEMTRTRNRNRNERDTNTIFSNMIWEYDAVIGEAWGVYQKRVNPNTSADLLRRWRCSRDWKCSNDDDWVEDIIRYLVSTWYCTGTVPDTGTIHCLTLEGGTK